MLTKEENEKLTRVEGEAPMGQLVRRFWIPVLLSADLPGPDCDPVRVRLLGEDLVAFRDTSGRVGLIDPLCAHRCADLFYGRNEENGIRCVYHGWKYDVTGQCVEAPTEPKDSNFRLTVRLRSYPVRERAEVLWTYMGPPELKPELPDFEFMHVPEGHLYASWSTQACNFVQAIEGGIDTIHVTTARWSISWTLDQPQSARDLAAMRVGSGVHVALVPGTHTPQRTRENNYLIDREEQRRFSFTGIAGIGEQDFAVQEGMGTIVDRRRERLGVTDGGIVQMRRRLLKAVDDLQEGVEPSEASHGSVYHVHAGDALLPAQVTNWAEQPNTKQALAARW